MRVCFGALLLLLMAAVEVSAHAGSVAYWRVVFRGAEARSQLLIAIDDVERMAPGLLSAVRPGALDVQRLGPFGETLLAHFTIEQAGARLPSRIVTAAVLDSGLLDVQVVHQIDRAATAPVLRSAFHVLTDDTHRVVVRAERDGAVAAMTLQAAAPSHAVPAGRQASWHDALAPDGSIRAMVLLGVAHILTGYDHLLFLACLLVPGGTWRSRVAVVSAFTAAHSLTLVLAATQVVTPPARFVELAIALSLAYVACENLMTERGHARWPTAFGFGLIHGLGFADVLRGQDLPMAHWWSAVAAFNVGVEIGQLAVMALVLPLVVLVARSSWHRRVVQGTSAAVIGLARVWFVERLS
jgi:hypothetical protein